MLTSYSLLSFLLTITRVTSLKGMSKHVIPLLIYSGWLPTVYRTSPNFLARDSKLFSNWCGSTTPTSFSGTSLPYPSLSFLALHFSQIKKIVVPQENHASSYLCYFVEAVLILEVPQLLDPYLLVAHSGSTTHSEHSLIHPQARLMIYTSHWTT